MKKQLVQVICGFLLAIPAWAQLTAEQHAEIERGAALLKRAAALLLEAESRAMERCDGARIVVPLPHMDALTKTERTVDTVVSIEWSGACVEGKRDGEGVLTWIEDKTTNTRMDQARTVEMRTLNTWKSEGRFVKGQRLGLWCMNRRVQLIRDGKSFHDRTESGCSVLAGNTKEITGTYRKQPDGSWVQYVDGAAGGSSLAAGTLEAQSAQLLAEATAGKTLQVPELVVQNRALDDLVRGSKIVLAASSATPFSLNQKRVAVVLSSRTLNDLERFKRERGALISASNALTGDAAKYRAEFIAASNPDRPLVNVAKTVRKHAKTVLPADDLVGLQKGEFDYALIIDWRHMTRFDLLGRYDDSYPARGESPAAFCESWAAFLVTPDLRAVRQLATPPQCYSKAKDASGDFNYMLMLATFFQSQWGKGLDDGGISMVTLDYFLKF